MSDTDAFATIRRARSLRERHPDAPAGALLVALVMATYANGRTGTSIRPGLETVAELTGLSLSTVQRRVRWLEERDELRRDKQGHRGSAACFTYTGGKAGHLGDTLSGESQSGETGKPVTAMTAHQPDQPNPSGPSRPSGDGATCDAEGCDLAGTIENFGGSWCDVHAARLYDQHVLRTGTPERDAAETRPLAHLTDDALRDLCLYEPDLRDRAVAELERRAKENE